MSYTFMLNSNYKKSITNTYIYGTEVTYLRYHIYEKIIYYQSTISQIDILLKHEFYLSHYQQNILMHVYSLSFICILY
jgi:hypothetical protein